MANYATLIQQINASIKTNGANLITGQMLQTILDNMVASLGAKYQYAGVATPATNPGTPDQNVFYLAATAGTYTNFGGLVVAEGEVAALKYNGAWAKDTTGAATADQVSQLGQKVDRISNVLTIDHSCFAMSILDFYSSSAYKRSDYISVYSGQRISYRLYGSNNVGVIAFFDSGKNYVSAVTGTYDSDVTVAYGEFVCPADGYVVISCGKSYTSDSFIQLSPNISQANEVASKNRDMLLDSSNLQMWVYGKMNSQEHASGDNNRLVTKNIIFAYEDIRISTDTDYLWYLFIYNASGERISTSSNWQSEEYIIPKGTYFRACMAKKDSSVLSLTDYSKIHLQVLAGVIKEIHSQMSVIDMSEDWRNHFIRGYFNTQTWEHKKLLLTSRVCINPEYPIRLSAGSIITFPLMKRIYPSWRVNGVINPGSLWYTEKFVCPVDGEYIFIYSNDPETDFTESTIDEIVADIRIYDIDKLAINQTIFEQSSKISSYIGLHDNIISIARLGYDIDNPETPPEQTIMSYAEAYKHGYRYMLADVQFTSDHVPVALHDVTINDVARNPDGTTISEDVYLADLSLAQVDEYDFGLIKGQKYAGTKIMRINDFIRWCKIMNCIPILEVKTGLPNNTDDNYLALSTIIKKYGMSKNVIFEADAGQATAVTLHTAFPNAAIAKTCVPATDFSGNFLTQTLALKGDNEVIWYMWINGSTPNADVPQAMIDYASVNGIQIGVSEVKTAADFNRFISNDNNLVCRYVAIKGHTFTDYVIQKEIL